MAPTMHIDQRSPETQTEDELLAMREYLRTLPAVATRGAAAAPTLPFAPLPELDADTLRAIEAAALVANERYLFEIIEEHSFCPFARGGRAQGLTTRFVHYFSGHDVTPLVELMAQVAQDPGLVIIQVILPMIDVSPEAWMQFCQEVTDFGNDALGGDAEVFAVAPLHPKLPYDTSNPYSLIPLFRRSPDPTIQWVRLDGLQGLYAGRSHDTQFVESHDVDAYLEKKHRPPLFSHIAETNLHMATRLGVDNIEQALAEVSQTAQKRYGDILLGGTPSATSKGQGACAFHAHPSTREVQEHTASVPPLQAERSGDVWNLASLRDLGKRVLRHVEVDGVDLVVVRIDDEVHTLYGRCPHRLALLSGALLEGERIVCPHHGWDFNLDSGVSEGVRGASVHRFASRVSEGRVWLDDAEVQAWREANPQAFVIGEIVP